MRTILPLGVLLALSLMSCSSSASSLTGPDDTKAKMEPGRDQPSQPCAPPPGGYQGLAGRSSSLSVSLSACTVVGP
jgi:hypothetical protein